MTLSGIKKKWKRNKILNPSNLVFVLEEVEPVLLMGWYALVQVAKLVPRFPSWFLLKLAYHLKEESSQ